MTRSYLSFISYRDGDGEICGMNADGTNQTRVTTNPAQDVYPRPHPYGKPSSERSAQPRQIRQRGSRARVIF